MVLGEEGTEGIEGFGPVGLTDELAQDGGVVKAGNGLQHPCRNRAKTILQGILQGQTKHF